jgi:hypothetical protein
MENWKPVIGFEYLYEVSDFGRVKRIAAGCGTQIGKIHKAGRRRDYLCHSLSKDGVKKTLSGHRMVWEAFNGLIPNNLQINHMNGDKKDNRLSNLEVVTQSQNAFHAIRVLGFVPSHPPKSDGENNGRAIVNEGQVREIRRLYAKGGISQTKLAKNYGFDQTSISNIVRRKTWQNVF